MRQDPPETLTHWWPRPLSKRPPLPGLGTWSRANLSDGAPTIYWRPRPRQTGATPERPAPTPTGGRGRPPRPLPSEKIPAGQRPATSRLPRRGSRSRRPTSSPPTRRARPGVTRPSLLHAAESPSGPPSPLPATLQSPGRGLDRRRAPRRTVQLPTLRWGARGPRNNGQIKAARAYAQ